jgi:DUF917 family protein
VHLDQKIEELVITTSSLSIGRKVVVVASPISKRHLPSTGLVVDE